jgi:G3E family GTPase
VIEEDAVNDAHAVPVPLVLLVGFLGAGKTTLLRGILPGLGERGLVPRVVLNDYLNADVDIQTLGGLTEHVQAIHGTCVCCGAREEMVRVLSGLPADPAAITLVEANGTVDAVELVEVLAADRRLGGHTLPTQISVVDAERWQRRHWHNRLEAHQVIPAHAVVITRSGNVTSRRLAEVEAGLRTLAPNAKVLDPVGLVTELALLHTSAAAGPGRRFTRSADASTHHSDHHFSATEVPLPEAQSRAALTSWLTALPPEVLRAKGIARLDDGQWVYFERLDTPGSVRISRIAPGGLDPVAILIGAGIPADLGWAAPARPDSGITTRRKRTWLR